MQHVKGPRLVAFLYNHNPFYLISACLVLYGIRSSFLADGTTNNPWIMAGLISGYTALLAITGYLIVRFGRVWDDARSIFMVLLILFFALSTSFDSLCILDPAMAVLMLVSGLVFAVLVTEFLLRGLEIQFGALFKCSYYLILSISFLYPLVMAGQRLYFSTVDMRWLVLGFSVLAAVSIVSLIPAVRRQKQYVAKNGTPWEWPMFPYSVFVLLLVGVCWRLAALAMAFDPTGGSSSILGGYLFVPIFLAVFLVILEIGIVERNEEVSVAAMVCLPVSIPLCLSWGRGYAQTNFTDLIAAQIGSPIWLTLVALILICWLARSRKVETANFFLTIGLFATLVVQQDGQLASSLGQVAVWPCCCLAILQLMPVEGRVTSGRFFKASLWMSFIIAVATESWLPNGVAWALGLHCVLMAAIVIAFSFQDRFAIQLRMFAAGCLPILAVACVIAAYSFPQLENLVLCYISGLATVGYTVYFAMANRVFLCSSVVTIFVAYLSIGIQVEPTISMVDRQTGLVLIVGLLFFVIGVLVSCLKAGLSLRWKDAFDQLKSEIRSGLQLADEDSLESQELVDKELVG